MWVLEDDKIFNEYFWAMKTRIILSENIRGKVLLGVRNNGEPIVAQGYNLVSYDLDDHKVTEIVDSLNHWTPFSHFDIKNNDDAPVFIQPFAEGLVLLNTDRYN